MKSGIITHDSALQFILGGKAYFTFLNTKTENRFTFKVTKHKVDNVYFVNVLTGPENYTFVGSIRDSRFKYSLKSKISNESQSVKVFAYVIDKLHSNNLPDIIEIYHDGRCGRCGHQLTTPESVRIGIGPDCIKKLKFK